MLTALFLTQIKGLVMNNTDKLLRAFIEVSGFDVEEVKEEVILKDRDGLIWEHYFDVSYKLTRKRYNSKPTLHKIIREYEKEGMSASEMIGRIMLLEGVTIEEI